mmetsp:Transcript_11915/g.36037  ORF Transcript_11915/g.36037 Transcript_11915/m.36037 type:complete len:294 (+) Transcript_11915:151-1032(+)
MADADEPHAPGPTSDSTSGGLHPLTAGLLARHDSQRAPTATALSKRRADRPAAEQERAAVRIRGAAPRMANLEPVEKTAVVSDSTGADAVPAIRARPTRSSSAQLALEPTALLNRLETMLLGNQPVPAPSNEVSIVGEVTNGIIIAAKAAVNTLFFVAAARRADGSPDKEPEEGCAGVPCVGPTRRAGGRATRAGGRVRQAARDARERRGQGVGQVQAAAGGRGGASRCRSRNVAGRAHARGARGRGGAGGRGPAGQRLPSRRRVFGQRSGKRLRTSGDPSDDRRRPERGAIR